MERLLLDSHTLLWALQDDPQLDQRARSTIADRANDVFVSAATVWEVAIKRALGRLEAPEDLMDALEQTEFIELPITGFHAELAAALPPHHRDPFDRMLVAQAQAEGLTIVTRDRHIVSYGVRTIGA